MFLLYFFTTQITREPKIFTQTVLEKAIENYRHQYILTQTNKAYPKLKKNPQAWEEETKERQSWENTLLDGLKDG